MNKVNLRRSKMRRKAEWSAMVVHVFECASWAMNRSFNSEAEVVEQIERIQAWIREQKPEGGPQAMVLEGVLWACVTCRFEDKLRGNDRTFLLMANVTAQRLLSDLRFLTKSDRNPVLRVLRGKGKGGPLLKYLVGALALARTAWAVGALGQIFVHATNDQDIYYGIDGWVKVPKSRTLVPVDVKASPVRRSSATVRVLRPERSRAEYRWHAYLEREGLPLRVMRIRARIDEGGGMIPIERSNSLVDALREALREWRRESYQIEGVIRPLGPSAP